MVKYGLILAASMLAASPAVAQDRPIHHEGDVSWQFMSGDRDSGAYGRSFSGGMSRSEVQAEAARALASGEKLGHRQGDVSWQFATSDRGSGAYGRPFDSGPTRSEVQAEAERALQAGELDRHNREGDTSWQF